jgi:uncharacterized NAD(P)/FAD-binding protein YdhS
MSDIAIVGLGPWGLSVLERLVAAVDEQGPAAAPARVHIVEPGLPGAGAFTTDLPDYLILNTPCGWHSVSAPPVGGPTSAKHLTFYAWLQERGYRWVGDECRIDPTGLPIAPGDFLPRRLMGEYLGWAFRRLLAEAPPQLHAVIHETSAVDIVSRDDGREQVLLADGSSIDVDHVVLTTGHTQELLPELAPGITPLTPYPARAYADTTYVPAGSSVAIRGMGLVALDVLAALTIGRGGSFVDHDGGLRYLPSGREPTVYLFSRSGYPYCAKSSQGTPTPSGAAYEPGIFTPSAIAALCATADDAAHSRRPLDIRAEVLPLLFAEMQLRFYTHSAHQHDGAVAAERVRDRLVLAWRRGTFAEAVAGYAGLYGAFDVASHFFVGADQEYLSAKDYEQAVYDVVRADLAEALRPGGESPLKAAYAVPRVLREALRGVIEFRGLTRSSHLDFQTNIRNKIGRLIAGPPTLRSAQLLALMDAGLVRLPFGPAPLVETTQDGRILVRSTNLAEPYAAQVDYLVQGTLEEPSLRGTSTPLLRNLRDAGRLQELCWGQVPAGSVDLTEDFHPVSASSDVQDRLWVFGPLTEGVRYYTGYIPSPKDQRASLDAARCVEHMLADSTECFERAVTVGAGVGR